MSILIKGMEMPQRCMDCGVDTGLCGLWNGYAERYSRRHPKCPLVEIPTPHGRLIDADKLMRDIEEYHLSDGKFQHWVDVQQTIIEAEGNDE